MNRGICMPGIGGGVLTTSLLYTCSRTHTFPCTKSPTVVNGLKFLDLIDHGNTSYDHCVGFCECHVILA